MHGPLNTVELERLRRLPAISRAREHRLYMTDGSRWIDCWADGARLLEGHRPGGLGKRIKNELDRGLYAPYPSFWEARLTKQLMRAFPGYAGVRFYRNAEAAFAAVGQVLESGSFRDLNWSAAVDPLDLPSDAHTAAAAVSAIPTVLWGRFLLPDHPIATYLLPIMPLSGLGDLQPLLYSEGYEPEKPSEIISPIILAAQTRSILSLFSGNRRKLPTIEEPSDIWEWRGPYMLYKSAGLDYSTLFNTMFAAGILIAPSEDRPSLFPMSPNEKETRKILTGGAVS